MFYGDTVYVDYVDTVYSCSYSSVGAVFLVQESTFGTSKRAGSRVI